MYESSFPTTNLVHFDLWIHGMMIIVVSVSFAFVGMSSEYKISTNVDNITLPVSSSTLQSSSIEPSNRTVYRESLPPCVMVTALDIEDMMKEYEVMIAIQHENIPKHNRRGRKGGPKRLSQLNTKVIVSDEPRRSTRVKRTFLQYDTVHLWASVQRRKRKSK